MTRIGWAGLALAGAMLTGCGHTPDTPPVGPGPNYEDVLAWRQNAAGDLVVRVYSNGCTNKDSFDAIATGSPRSGWSFDVTLERLYPDECEAILPQGVELVWTRDELGLPPSAEIELTNRVDTFRTVPPQPVG